MCAGVDLLAVEHAPHLNISTMALIALYTNSPDLSVANELLDTQMGILPYSIDILRLGCILETRVEPLEHLQSNDDAGLDDDLSRLAERSALAVKVKGEGKVVIIKNGNMVWRAISAPIRNALPMEDVHIIFNFTEADGSSPSMKGSSNSLAVSAALLSSWPREHVINVGPNSSVLTIQNEFRAIILKHSPGRLTGLTPGLTFKPWIHGQSLGVIVAFGGLSECGKSTFGGVVDRIFGSQGRRMKIGYVVC